MFNSSTYEFIARHAFWAADAISELGCTCLIHSAKSATRQSSSDNSSIRPIIEGSGRLALADIAATSFRECSTHFLVSSINPEVSENSGQSNKPVLWLLD